MRHGKGRIVWISSVAGLVKVPFDGAYAASKHVVEGICSVMHEELKPYGVERWSRSIRAPMGPGSMIREWKVWTSGGARASALSRTGRSANSTGSTTLPK
ncbi:SDR family NAD(P)-dependent oxidoreductase [Paracoccus sp. APAP_BH8]|uniref:SDR family NAD(P)-dependent oxidoreductase n=1 Tax=Paracoccus sp. APAP_BH8 TaxID=3110237 RepID=UPI002FD7D5B6